MRSRLVLSCLCAVALLAACSQPENKQVPLTLNLPANPVQGTEVRVVSVADSRSFELRPHQPHTPSLLPEDFDNPGVRQRAIGRQRDSYGKAVGAVLLPDGQSVTALFRDATILAFRQSGYRVLSPGDPGFDRAVPVAVTIRDYWTWMAAAGGIGRISCRAEANVQAPFAPLAEGLVIAGLAQQGTPLRKAGERAVSEAVTDADWPDVTSRCLIAYGDNLKAMLAR